MDELAQEFEIGDSVLVTQGVRHPDLDQDLSGWQGRVFEIETGGTFEQLIGVEWDSITLRDMPEAFIETADEAGIDWTRAYLLPDALQPTRPRDSEEDATVAAMQLSELYETAGYADEEDEDEITAQLDRIEMLLADADSDEAELEQWAAHLSQALVFPFAADVAYYQERGPLQEGDTVSVSGISLVDEEHGLIVSVKHRGNSLDFPLSQLEPMDETSANFQLVDDYIVWFENRHYD
ncbi:MAG TPA: calcium-binding protein [Candidatus Sulfomarinibacteraceae bacterium]|nr:calcium-binding protein [Candidatus Sulfomarinibacteraceae bacterium]